MELRPYQTDALDAVYAAFGNGKRRPLLSLPTGAGKTVIAAELAAAAAANSKRVLIATSRVTLVDQIEKVCAERGLQVGRWQADTTRDTHSPVVAASTHTLAARNAGRGFGLVIHDECDEWSSWTATLVGSTPAVGMTATPLARWLFKEHKGRGPVFDELIVGATTKRLWDEGWLMNPRVVHCGGGPDMHGAEERNGEWTDRAAAERTAPLLNRVIDAYRGHGERRPALVFASSIHHAEILSTLFNAHGFPALPVTAESSAKESRAAVEALRFGDVQVLVSVAKLAVGFDCPRAAVCIVVRPLKTLRMHIQMLGRVYRIDPGKEQPLILDLVGNCARLREPTAQFYGTGRPPPIVEGPARLVAPGGDGRTKCPACGVTSNPGASVCGACWTPFADALGADWDELIDTQQTDPDKVARIVAARHFLRNRDEEKAKKRGLAAYRTLVGVWPAWGWKETLDFRFARRMGALVIHPDIDRRLKAATSEWLANRYQVSVGGA